MKGDAINAILCGAGHNLRRDPWPIEGTFVPIFRSFKAALQTLIRILDGNRPSDNTAGICLIDQIGFRRIDQLANRGWRTRVERVVGTRVPTRDLRC